MVFSSLVFIFAFLPVVWAVFHFLKSECFARFWAKFMRAILPQKFTQKATLSSYTLAKVFLICASLFFYAYFKLEYLPILLGTIIVNFLLAKLILNVNSACKKLVCVAENGGGGGAKCHCKFTPKFYFILGVIFNLCLLGFFKYTDFLLENFNAFAKLANLDFEIPLPHILLPIALSFVTFQQIAFLFDCYKRTKGEISENLSINFIDHALFISFFPQLIAGPIVHHREMMPQFSQISQAKSTINYEFLAKGLFIFSIGLFKKVFIADSFAKWADAGFGLAEKGQVLNIAESWATSLSYTFQLYFDFSGYCDMAIGLGLAFGIVLPLNFNSPYKSRNIAEFWRRWHITLGRFLKECLYIPLGGNRVGKILNLRNLFIVAFLSGVWHGAGWGFVIWGVLHGAAMLVHRIYGWFCEGLKTRANAVKSSLREPQGSKQSTTKSGTKNAMDCFGDKSPRNDGTFAVRYLKFTQSKLYSALCWFITFNFVNLAWIFFRAENLQGALNLLKGMFGVVWIELPSKWHRMPETLAQISGRNDTIFYILIAILLCVFAKNSVELTRNFRSNALKFSLSLRLFGRRIYLKGSGIFVKFALALGLFWGSVWLLCKGALSANAYTPFIYFNF